MSIQEINKSNQRIPLVFESEVVVGEVGFGTVVGMDGGPALLDGGGCGIVSLLFLWI